MKNLIALALVLVAACATTPEATLRRAEGYVTSAARTAIAQDDVTAEQVAEIVAVVRAAAEAAGNGAFQPGELDVVGIWVKERLELDNQYVGVLVDAVVIEADIWLSENGMALPSNVADVLNRLADALERAALQAGG